MKLSKKALRVYTKLYIRSLKRDPSTFALSLMFIFTFSLSSYMGFDAYLHKNRYAKSTFTKWEGFQKKYVNRSIANVNEVCAGKDVKISVLDQEIKELEKQFETGHVIEGNWYGVNLQSLPSIQAQLLADFGHLIGDKNKAGNYKDCEDVICIFSKNYQDESFITGKIVYYWYLKTGSMISLANELPNQESPFPGKYNNQVVSFDQYLFTPKELQSFYILAKSLPTSFLHNPLFKSIHKVPLEQIEGYSKSECGISRPEGQILISSNCIQSEEDFLINITSQIARYIDQFEGLKSGNLIYSSTDKWHSKSFWIQEPFLNPHTKRYSSRWFSQLEESNHLSQKASLSPTQQFSQLLSHYRFNPIEFSKRTPNEISSVIKDKFYSNQTFDPQGMFHQYFTQSTKEWSRKEVEIWSYCFEKHLEPGVIHQHGRDLASSLEDPLYSCVEEKIPNFIDHVVDTIKKNNFEGCRFFNDSDSYAHLSERYFEVLNKFLMEKVLQRKLELQNHGVEVLIGQKAKDEFIKNIDPASIFINCFSHDDKKSCYDKKVSQELNKIMNKHRDISDYYKKIVRDDILNLYSYDEIALKTNQIAKKFITPFYSNIHYGAKHIWNSCKKEGSDENYGLSYPLEFTGGRFYVNPKLLKCVNENMQKELDHIVNLGAFQELDEKIVEFKLNKAEKDFALSFLHGKLIQVLNNILEEEVKVEKNMLLSHFKHKKQDIIKHFENTGSLLTHIYSFDHVNQKCLEDIKSFYPKNIYYFTKKDVDESRGREICSSYIERADVRSKITNIVEARWEDNKKLAESFVDKYFYKGVKTCNKDYPLDSSMRNTRMRNICIEEAYKEALHEALEDWESDKHHQYFSSKEKELTEHLMYQMHEKVQDAQKI